MTTNISAAGTAGRRVIPLLTVMAGVYTVQSTLGALMFMGMPAIMRDQGVGLELIGAVSLFMVPWSIKFLWSPLIERWRLAREGHARSRLMIVMGQLVMAGLVAACTWLPLEEGLAYVFGVFGLIAIIAGTVDIAGDGFMIERLKPSDRGWGNVVQVGGGYAGIMLGSGLFLILYGTLGWQSAVLVIAAIVVAMTTPWLLMHLPGRVQPPTPGHRPSLLDAFARPSMRWGILVIVLCQIGLRLSLIMLTPFMIDNGVSPEALGTLTGVAGTMVSLACIGTMGFLIRQWGAKRCLFLLLAAQGIVFGWLAVMAVDTVSLWLLKGLFLANSGVMAATFVALYTVAMDWTSPDQAGVDFTLIQCTDALVSVLAGLSGGFIAANLGYAACFGLASAAAVICVAAVPQILRHIERE